MIGVPEKSGSVVPSMMTGSEIVGRDEASEIVEISKQAGVPVMVNENWRWQRWYREISAMIQAGRIGQPFYYSMQMRARNGYRPLPDARSAAGRSGPGAERMR